MRKKLKKGVMIGLGLATIAKESVEKKVKELEKQGKINKKEAKKFLNKVNKLARSKQGHIVRVVAKEADRAISTLAETAKKDLRKFEKRRVKTVKKKRITAKKKRKKKR